MPVTAEQPDYRTSHLADGKGRSYDAAFRELPWRAFMWQRERRVLDEILWKHFAGRPIAHLDFACGTGRVLGAVGARARLSVGVDVSPGMLQVARRNAPTVELIQADITRGDVLGDEVFDLITAFRFFPNAQDELRADALRALVAHLADGGLLVFNNHRNDSSLLHRLARLAGGSSRTLSLAEVHSLTGSAGLRILEAFPIGILPATDRHMLVPPFLHRLADGLARGRGWGIALAQNVIFVCGRQARRRGRPAAARSAP
jgi:SAM-dependent methyltransferase